MCSCTRADTYTKIRFNIDPNNNHTGLRDWEHATGVQVAELALYGGGAKLYVTNIGGVATNPGGNTPAAEGADMLIDGDTSTKWCVHFIKLCPVACIACAEMDG